jgi:hypothetical protein
MQRRGLDVARRRRPSLARAQRQALSTILDDARVPVVMAPRRKRPLALIAPGFAVALVLWAWAHVRAEPAPGGTPPPAAPTAPAPSTGSPPPPAPTGAPARVTVGLYLQNIPEIDIKANSFTAEFYLWFRWRGDIDPTLTYQLTNAVNVAELSRIPIYADASGAPVPEVLPGGEKLQTFHIYGRFGHPFPLVRYPFDDHDIVISIEDAKLPIDRLVHVIDARDTAKRPDLAIPGWQLGAMQSQLGTTTFASHFGDTREHGGGETYSRVNFVMHIDRPVVGIVSKTVIPIALILLITFGAFFCQPSDIDARLCLTITALISAVALQITAATELPPTGSLLLLDQIYILSYVTILTVTFLCIAANRLVHAEQPERASALDRWGFRLVSSAYFGLLILLVMRVR